MSARTLGDDNRLVESSRYLATFIGDYLTESASQGYRFSAEQLEQIRQNLTLIAINLGDDPDIPDPHRLTTVLDSVNDLIRYVDDYPQAP